MQLQHIGFYPNVDMPFGSGDHVQIGTDVQDQKAYMFADLRDTLLILSDTKS